MFKPIRQKGKIKMLGEVVLGEVMKKGHLAHSHMPRDVATEDRMYYLLRRNLNQATKPLSSLLSTNLKFLLNADLTRLKQNAAPATKTEKTPTMVGSANMSSMLLSPA